MPGVVPKYAVLFNKAKLEPKLLEADSYKSPFTSLSPLKNTKFKVRDSLRYLKDGHSEFCTVKSVRMKNLNSPLEYEVLLDGSETSLFVTRESLMPLEASDVSDVKLSDGQINELSEALKCGNLMQSAGQVR